MATIKEAKEKVDVMIIDVKEGSAEMYLRGKTPLILNRLAEKAQRELLLPGRRKTEADKASKLKHDPIAEFRSSAHTIRDEAAPTYLGIPSSAPKRAMASEPLDIPGAKKAQIGRLTWVEGDIVGIYGIPKLFMRIVRNSDIGRTPDVRTRCIIEDWCAHLVVHFAMPLLKPNMIFSLMSNAGLYVGIGDGRTEKGALNYGQFTVLGTGKLNELDYLLKCDRAIQKHCMELAEPFDQDTEELLGWFRSESKTRGFSASAGASDAVEIVV